MNSALKSFILAQAEQHPTFKADFPNIFIDERFLSLNLNSHFNPNDFIINSNYLNTDQHLEDCIKEPFMFLTVGRYNGKKEKIWAALKQNHLTLIAIDPDCQTEAMVKYCLNKSPELIAYCNRDHVDQELAKQILDANALLFEFLPENLQHYKNAVYAVNKDVKAIKHIPVDIIDDTIVASLKQSKEFILDQVPFEVWDEELGISQIQSNTVQSLKAYIDMAIEHRDYSLFYFVVDSIQIIDKNIQALTRILDKTSFLKRNCIDIINAYLEDRPESIIFYDLQYLSIENINKAIELGLNINIPATHWDKAYKAIYNISSPLAYTAGIEQAHLVDGHELKWTTLWISKYAEKEEGEKPYLSPIFLTKEIMDKEELWSKILDSRVLYKLQKDNLLYDLEAMKEVNINTTHPYEIEQLKDFVESEWKLQLFNQDRFWYFLLDDDQKDAAISLEFIREYPQFIKAVPSEVANEKFLQNAIELDPLIQEYI